MFKAQRALRTAHQAHDAVRNQLLEIVLRVMREVNAETPGYADKLSVHRGQMLLGEKVAQVVPRSLLATGITLSLEEINKFTETSIALDLAITLNDHGTEVEYDRSKRAVQAAIANFQVVTTGFVSDQVPVPWTILGPEYQTIILMTARGGKLTIDLPNASPETTFHELLLALRPADVVQTDWVAEVKDN